MKTKSKITAYIVHSIAAAVLVLTAQIGLAGSATWLSSPQDSAWENANNWTPGGPPNGPSDIATFAQSSQTSVNVSTLEEVNSIVFTSASNSFTLNIPADCFGCSGGELIISGTGVTNNNSVLQTFVVGEAGQIIFNNTSTAATAQMRIVNYDLGFGVGGQTIFNDTSSAAGASIENASAELGLNGDIGRTIFNDASTADHASISNDGAQLSHGIGAQTTFNGTSTAANASIDNQEGFGFADGAAVTIFNDTSSAGHATITNHGELEEPSLGGVTIFNDSSTADSATLIANGASNGIGSGAIAFEGGSTGGTAQVMVFDYGYLDISGHQSGVTIGSIEGSGNVFLGANRLTVGINDIDTSFSGVISSDGQGGSLAKIGSGVITLQTNTCIADTVGLILVSDSIINLDFTGPPDVIASLVVGGVAQPPGIYGGPMSGAPHILSEFGSGLGTVEAGPISTLGNISTRAFVQTGDNVMIGGFIVQGAEPKKVVIRAIGPSLTQYGVANPLLNPTLELHDDTGALIASNDNWGTTIIGGIITSDQVTDILNSGYAPGDIRESAMIVSLPPGNYTAIVRGVANMTGVALAEVYDLSPAPDSTLGNISTRSFVQTGDNVMIGGFIVQGTQPRSVIIRAIGPELTQYGVPNVLADPTLELHDATGALIASNDNWQHTIIGGIITASQVRDILNSGYAPGDPRESAIIADLPAGNYTAIVRGANNTTGVALVEVYDLH
ncbi:MAG: hypothetical protein E6L08_09200 [Verrucomicrobia bacterium]|nr:MAG: hypothetical protein E6L08_09200 [Verrucomicrobiota bacterium]